MHAKESEIRNALEFKSIDVLFLQEIDLTHYSEGLVHFPSFTSYVHKGEKKRTCILIRNNTFKTVEHLPNQEDDPQVWIKVEEKSGKKLTIANIYREWNSNQEHILSKMVERFQAIASTGGRLIIGGDFNLDPSRLNDPTYQNRHTTSNFIQQAEEVGPQRTSFGMTFTRTIKSLTVDSELDWVLSNIDVYDPENVKFGMSDHSLISWKTKHSGFQLAENFTWYRNYSIIDASAFSADLAMCPWEDFVTAQCGEMASRLHDLFIGTLDRHAPTRCIKKQKLTTPRPSQALQKLRRQRDNARSKGQLQKLRKLRSECNNLTKKEAHEQVRNRLKGKTGAEWKLVNEILGCGTTSKFALREGPCELNEKESADALNSHFINKIKDIRQKMTKNDGDPLWGAKRRAKRLGLTNGSFRLRTVSEQEVEEAIRSSKNSKCPDIYGIAPAAIKLAPKVLSVPLTWLINSIIIQGVIPDSWKCARILPQHKSGSRNKKENYRPISILPSFSKILEKVVAKQLVTHLEAHKVLPPSQYGFRRNLSTTHALAAIDHDWREAGSTGRHCGALLLDLSAAFDTLDPHLLVEKLAVYGANRSLRSLISSYMCGRRQNVDCNGNLSGELQIMFGSPQGSVMSPILFLVMVADIEEWISVANVLSYADDTTIYTSQNTKERTRDVLEGAAIEVIQFMEASKLSLNPSKTQFIMIGRKMERDIKVGNVAVAESSNVTLLGVTLNKSLTWKAHLDKLAPILRQRIGILRRLSFQLPLDTIRPIRDGIFTSKVKYCLTLITNVYGIKGADPAQSQLHKLHRSAMKASLRIATSDHPPDDELLKKSGQISVKQIAATSIANLAVDCLQNWKSHPLTTSRIVLHLGSKRTRQSQDRTFPPQPVRNSLLGRMVEAYEDLPKYVRDEPKKHSRKCLIKKLMM